MPSHSKKQHNFMEAIAHSPSFAKKAGVPQSVGKDYAAADKGKTFGKGGEMKESKGMVGKEVAFMKKKGAPKSMIKHEMAEMKRGGKVRRMAEGGETDMSMGYGDPFAKPRDYDKEKAQGADSLKRLKGFFGFGDKEEKEAPVPRPSLDPSLLKFNKEEPVASTSRVSSDEGIRTSSGSQRKTSSDEAKGPVFSSNNLNMGEGEYSGDGLTPAQGYKPSSMPSASRRPKEVSVEKEKTKVTTKPGYRRSGATAEELERYAGPFRVTESANKMRKEAEDKIRDSKPGSMTKQMRDAPSISKLYAGQKSMSDEIGDSLKSFRASIRGGLKTAEERRKMREAESNMAKGGKVKKMAFGGDTGQPMRGAAPMKPAMQPPRVPLLNPNRPGISDLAKQKMGAYNQGMLGRIAASKKMAEGGVARADGIAKKGKTEGKMVKMAAGGFVKSADGCAQRGKTRASQVKMNRGGMC